MAKAKRVEIVLKIIYEGTSTLAVETMEGSLKAVGTAMVSFHNEFKNRRVSWSLETKEKDRWGK